MKLYKMKAEAICAKNISASPLSRHHSGKFHFLTRSLSLIEKDYRSPSPKRHMRVYFWRLETFLLSAWKAKKCFCLLGIRRLALFVCWEYDVWHFWTFYFNLYANTNQLHAWKHCSCIFDTFLAFSRTRIFKNFLSFQVFPTILAILTIFKTL